MCTHHTPAKPAKAKTAAVCTCHAYKFPHRAAGGACKTEPGMPFCGRCGLACTTHREDHGVGAYEFWGRTGVHREIVEVSDCCGASVYDDPSEIDR